MEQISFINKTMELADCRERWFFDETHRCWCLEDILYTPVPKDARFQRMSIYVPEYLMGPGGVVKEEALHVPVIFQNSAAGYAQMPHFWPENPNYNGSPYLERGWVYVTCGCRGRETRDENGRVVGKAPATLVDFKTAIRFLRHNRGCLPGDLERIISVGCSAGGAMSTLLGVTGDNQNFLPYLKENGAFMDESDRVYACQIYCPITDLEHANMAYEWMFRKDKENEFDPTCNAETLPAFMDALSEEMFQRYIGYFNSLGLKDPDTGELLELNGDGRSGTGYEYLMKCLDESATCYLTKLQKGELKQPYGVEQYLSGDYTYMGRGRRPKPASEEEPPRPALSHGELNLRPADRKPLCFRPPLVEKQGVDKTHWLTWDGRRAHVSDLDTYVLNHRRRMKPCPAFDALNNDSPENEVFGTQEQDFRHFDEEMAEAIARLKERFPEEYERHYADCAGMVEDADLKEKIRLYNPWNFIGTKEISNQAKHYRVRVGGCDADTSFMISMTLALKIANAGLGSVDYAIVWDQPHCEADYPGEVCDWIESII